MYSVLYVQEILSIFIQWLYDENRLLVQSVYWWLYWKPYYCRSAHRFLGTIGSNFYWTMITRSEESQGGILLCNAARGFRIRPQVNAIRVRRPEENKKNYPTSEKSQIPSAMFTIFSQSMDQYCWKIEIFLHFLHFKRIWIRGSARLRIRNCAMQSSLAEICIYSTLALFSRCNKIVFYHIWPWSDCIV